MPASFSPTSAVAPSFWRMANTWGQIAKLAENTDSQRSKVHPLYSLSLASISLWASISFWASKPNAVTGYMLQVGASRYPEQGLSSGTTMALARQWTSRGTLIGPKTELQRALTKGFRRPPTATWRLHDSGSISVAKCRTRWGLSTIGRRIIVRIDAP